MSSSTSLNAAPTDAIRRRLVATLFVLVALGAIGLFSAFTVASIAADRIGGSAAWAGLPFTASILGTALGAWMLSLVMASRGRKAGLVLGYGIGSAGALLAVIAVNLGALLLLLAGMFLIGVAHAAHQLARYAAADIAPAERRASWLGLLVWAGTVGAVLGPLMLGPSEGLAARIGVPAFGGGFLVATALCLVAFLGTIVFLRPDPTALAVIDPPSDLDAPRAGLSGAIRSAPVQIALAAMVAGQIVMIFIMTMTPVHIHHAGGTIGAVGFVFSAHVVGMYGFSPVAGLVGDRVGSIPAILIGLALLAAGALGAAATPVAGLWLAPALLVLGLGWSFSFVAGSSLLTRGVNAEERVRVQGTVDSLVWVSAAAASSASGLVLKAVGFTALCLYALPLLGVPLAVIAMKRRAMAAAMATA